MPTSVDSLDANGYLNGRYTEEGMDEDGFFTCAVSVQHKKHDSETAAGQTSIEEEQTATTATGRKVVWPANNTSNNMEQQQSNRVIKKAIDSKGATYHQKNTTITVRASESNSNTNVASGQAVDHPHFWLAKQDNDQDDRGTNGHHQQQQQAPPARISRSRSRSKNIMERARSFERAAHDAAMGGAEMTGAGGTSRPVSRSGSFRNRSSSGARNAATANMENNWNQMIDRPGSRTDVDSRRFMEVGRVNTQCWEDRIHHGSTENIAPPPRTPPPPRKEMNIMKQTREEDISTPPPPPVPRKEVLGGTPTPPRKEVLGGTPEPPPPPVRMHQMPRQEHMFPPPPCSAGSKLSEESVNMLSQDNKEKSVQDWVNSTTQSRDQIQKELEKFAYDIAESVVSTMEKNSDKSSSRQDLSGAAGNQMPPTHLVNQFWDRQMSIPESVKSSSGGSSSHHQYNNIDPHQQVLGGSGSAVTAGSQVLAGLPPSGSFAALGGQVQVDLPPPLPLPGSSVTSSGQVQADPSHPAAMFEEVAAPSPVPGAGAGAGADQQRSSGVFRAVPAQTSQSLHGPIYVQQDHQTTTTASANSSQHYQYSKQEHHQQSNQTLHGPVYIQQDRGGQMTFQQEERRRQELRAKEEKLQEERRRLEEEKEMERLRVEEENKRREAEKQRMLEEQRRHEEQRRQEERRRLEEEQKRREEERKMEEMRRMEEERMRQQLEEQRRYEEEMRRREEMKRKEEERRLALEAEEKRKQEEEMRRKMEEEKERKRREEHERYEKLKREEEACRIEEMRLEQELRRQYEMQQQQQKQQLEAEQEAAKKYASQDEINVREHIPKINKYRAFDSSQDRLNEAGKEREHLGKVRTGQVSDRRNFWIRSSSADRSGGGQGLSPAPRRKRINTWSKPKEATTDEGDSRPGSSMGQAAHGSVKNLTNGFLSKSRSTAAVMQDGCDSRGRPPSRTRQEVAWTKEKYDENTNNLNFLKSQEVKTNKVNETITSWGKQEETGRITPAPSRNISQVFSDNKVAKAAEHDKHANSWRTKTPEPSVKLVNVHVEKSAGSTQNIHISDSAHTQLASFVQETSTSTATSTNGYQEFTTTTTSSFDQQQQLQPPPPERNTSIGGKSTTPACNKFEHSYSDPTPPPSAHPVQEKNKFDSVLCERTESPPASTCTSPPTSACSVVQSNQSVTSVKNSNNNTNTNTSVMNTTSSKQDKLKQQHHLITHSASAQSINSTLSTCSSGKIPLPIKNSWFEADDGGGGGDRSASAASVLASAASSCSNIPAHLLSPTGGRTPVPVSAQWFTHSDLTTKSAAAAFTAPLSGSTSQLSSRAESGEKIDSTSTDDIDTKSVKSDTTVIENIEHTATPAPVSAPTPPPPPPPPAPMVPPRPVELKRPYSPPLVPRNNTEPKQDLTHASQVQPDLIPTNFSDTKPMNYSSQENRMSVYENVDERSSSEMHNTIISSQADQSKVSSNSFSSKSHVTSSKTAEQSSKIRDQSQSASKRFTSRNRYDDKSYKVNLPADQNNEVSKNVDMSNPKINDQQTDPVVNKTFLTEHMELISIQSATNSFCSTAADTTTGDSTTDRESVLTDVTAIADHPSEIIAPKPTSEMERDLSQQTNVSDYQIQENAESVADETNELETPSIITVPQSPSEIRKKFQQNSHAQKKFQKSADLELSREFRQGVRGKVRESKQSFLANTNSDKFLEAKEQREMELQQIRLQRSESKTRVDSPDDSPETRADRFRQEKLRELHDVQRSRQDSAKTEETISSTSYMEQKKEREQELATLAHRKIDLEDAAFFSPTELKEHQLREEREKELAALCARSYVVEQEQEPIISHPNEENQQDQGPISELNPVTTRVISDSPKPSSARRGSGLTLPAATIQDLTRELDALTDEAFEVLDFSKQPKSNNTNNNLVNSSVGGGGEPEIDAKSVRDTKAMWLQREARSGSRGATGGGDRSNSNTPTPSRRIGSMFKKEADYWNIEDELPAPPTAAVEVAATHEDDCLPPPPQQQQQQAYEHPPPPPRQSSRGKVDEYRSWSGTWKSTGSFGHHN